MNLYTYAVLFVFNVLLETLINVQTKPSNKRLAKKTAPYISHQMENRGIHFSRLLQKLLVSSKGTKQITKVVTTKKCNTEDEYKKTPQNSG